MNTLNQFAVNAQTITEVEVQAAAATIAERIEAVINGYVFWSEVNTDGVLTFGGRTDVLGNFQGILIGNVARLTHESATSDYVIDTTGVGAAIALIHARNEAYAAA